MWSEGDYDYTPMQKLPKKLERPTPGSAGQRITGMVGFVDEAPSAWPAEGTHTYAQSVDGAPQSLVYLAESLYLLPESFDDELIDGVWQHWQNPDVLFVAGDLDEDLQFTEEEAVAIYANYGQVRQYLHTKSLNRGFFPSTAPGSKGKGKGKKGGRLAITDRPSPFTTQSNTARPELWSKDALIARTKCARCGEIGHWARTCSNPPDEWGKRRQGQISNTGFMITDVCAAPCAAPPAFLFTHSPPLSWQTMWIPALACW